MGVYTPPSGSEKWPSLVALLFKIILRLRNRTIGLGCRCCSLGFGISRGATGSTEDICVSFLDCCSELWVARILAF